MAAGGKDARSSVGRASLQAGHSCRFRGERGGFRAIEVRQSGNILSIWAMRDDEQLLSHCMLYGRPQFAADELLGL